MNDLIDQLRRAYVLLDDGDRRALAAQQITTTQYALLHRIDAGPPEGLPVSRLAEQMLCTRGNISRLVSRLETAGHVHTGTDGDDQRLVLVQLTEAGQETLRQARTSLDQVDGHRFSGLATAEQRQLTTLLTRLAESLTADLDEQPLPKKGLPH